MTILILFIALTMYVKSYGYYSIMPINKGIYYYSLRCLLALLTPYANATEVTLATGINDDPPYVYGEQEISIEYPGVTIDVLKLVEKKTNIKFNILKQPWARVVENVKTNQLDGGFHFSFKEERKSFVAYPIPKGMTLPDSKYSISNRSYVLYRLKGEETHWNGERIVTNSKARIVIGAIRGGSITGDIKNLGYELLEVNTDNQLLKLLLAKRIDALIGLENMIDAKIQSFGVEQTAIIEKTSPVVVNKPYYVAFSKKFYRENPQKAWKIWKTIELIKNNGELTEIFSRYARR